MPFIRFIKVYANQEKNRLFYEPIFQMCTKRVVLLEIAAAAKNEDQPDQGTAAVSVSVVAKQTNTVPTSIIIVAKDG